jgi:uncharacterized membrane protein YeiB
MATVTSPFPLTTPRGNQSRLAFPDVTRAIALSGIVIMNYHAYLNGAESRNPINPSLWEDIFNPVTGFLTTRFAALFVVVAGVSVALMTVSQNNKATQGSDTNDRRVVILRRGVLLAFVGGIFEWIWPGSILYYYGAYFLLGAWIIRARTSIVIACAAVSTIAATAIQTWRVGQEFDGRYTGWLDPSFIDSPRELLLRTFVGYTHPVFPWFAFFCIGLLIGRLTPHLKSHRRTIFSVALLCGISAYVVREVVYQLADGSTRSDVLSRTLASTDPFDRGVLYTVSAASIAVIVVLLIHSWCEKASTSMSRTSSVLVDSLQRVGQFTFTIYIGHALFFNLVVYRLRIVDATGLDTALVLSGAFLTVAVVFALWWTRIIGQGPLERAYRWLTGS